MSFGNQAELFIAFENGCNTLISHADGTHASTILLAGFARPSAAALLFQSGPPRGAMLPVGRFTEVVLVCEYPSRSHPPHCRGAPPHWQTRPQPVYSAKFSRLDEIFGCDSVRHKLPSLSVILLCATQTNLFSPWLRMQARTSIIWCNRWRPAPVPVASCRMRIYPMQICAMRT